MKTNFFKGLNAILAFLVGLFGFTSCDEHGELVAEYGCPYATFKVSGNITDEAKQPVENIQVKVKNDGYQIMPEGYSDENGRYMIEDVGAFPVPNVDIIVTDTAGVFDSDSVRVEVTYDRSKVSPDDHWNDGEAVIQYDFQLKKK